MGLAPQHTFQVLTKRPERMARYLNSRPADHGPWRLPNVWLGVSVEDQATADARIPLLLQTPAALRFISAEPLLGPVSISEHLRWVDHEPPIGWVIVGGESGRGARPMHPDWARSLRDQCTVAGVPFFFKQWGEWVELDGPRCAGRRQDISAPKVWIEQDGRTRPTQPPSLVHSIYHHSIMARIGKKAAGALLDGREHKEFPT